MAHQPTSFLVVIVLGNTPIATSVFIIVAIAGAMLLVESPKSVMPSPPSSADAATPGSTSENQPRSPRQVSRFKDTFGVVYPYCRRFDFELDPDFNYRDNLDYEDEEDSNHVPNPRETLIRYVNQIRKSFGFDVDCVPPSWFCGPFIYIDLQTVSEDPHLCDFIKNVVDYAVAEISAETGKKYELVKVEKVVAAPMFILFSTIRVKEVAVDGTVVEEKTIQAIACGKIASEEMELLQWRFKPDEEDAWFELPPLNHPRSDATSLLYM